MWRLLSPPKVLLNSTDGSKEVPSFFVQETAVISAADVKVIFNDVEMILAFNREAKSIEEVGALALNLRSTKEYTYTHTLLY